MNAPDLLAVLLAPGTYRSWDTEPVDVRPDPGYAADLAQARRKTGLDESVITGDTVRTATVSLLSQAGLPAAARPGAR